MRILLGEIWRAWRASLRRPGFLLLATGVLALGVAASVAVFSLIDGVLLKPLPYPQPQQLAAMGVSWQGSVRGISPQQYQHLGQLDGVRSLGLIERHAPPVNIAGDGPPQQVPAIYADHHLLPTLGVHPVLGRNFTADEDRPNGPRAVIIGHGLWLRRFGGDRQIIGHSLRVEGRSYTIVGVLPAGFHLVDGEVMLPTRLRAHSSIDAIGYLAVARLAPGTSMAAVSAQVDARLHAMYADAGDNDAAAIWKHAHFGADSLHVAVSGDSKPVLDMFVASAALVLLIALVNLTNLMLLRGLSRTHEGAIRAALGAQRMRLLLPALAEGVLVGVGGGLLGLVLAEVCLLSLQRFMPDLWVDAGVVRLTPSMWALSLSLGMAGALLSALLGTWRGRLRDASLEALREGGRSGLGWRGGRLSRGLVVVQVALATSLLGAAGLFLHTLYDAAHVPLGFSGQGIVSFELSPIRSVYTDTASIQALSQQVLQRLRAQPGVRDATVTTNLPTGTFTDQAEMGMFHRPGGQHFTVQFRGVGANFFHLFDIHLRRGRLFTRGDVAGSERVAIVNRAFAEHHFGGDAIGKTIERDTGRGSWSARVVGVVADTRQFGPLRPAPDMLYLPLTQVPDHEMGIFRYFGPLRFAMSVRGNPDGYAASIRTALHEVAPDQPIANVRPMTTVIAQTTRDARMDLVLVGVFAALALLLAGAGLYAVMAVAVATREREFGVRTALGASPWRLTGNVLRGALWQVATGLVLGLVLAFALSGLLRTVIEQAGHGRVFDPLDIVGVGLLLMGCGLLACLLPALRAGRVQPMQALRSQ